MLNLMKNNSLSGNKIHINNRTR